MSDKEQLVPVSTRQREKEMHVKLLECILFIRKDELAMVVELIEMLLAGGRTLALRTFLAILTCVTLEITTDPFTLSSVEYSEYSEVTTELMRLWGE